MCDHPAFQSAVNLYFTPAAVEEASQALRNTQTAAIWSKAGPTETKILVVFTDYQLVE